MGKFSTAIFFIFMVLIMVGISYSAQSDLPIKTIHVGAKVIKVEIALTESERSKGLGNRSSLPDNQGMLFIFKKESILSFWMKDTLIPLDIAFVNKSGRILKITTMTVEKFGTPLNEYKTYTSEKPARYAIEMNAGWFKENNISVGDVVKELVPAAEK